MKCPICTKTFDSGKGQLKARWVISWCESVEGLLCPDCHEAARQLECLEGMSGYDTLLRFQCWGSDIAKRSKSVTGERRQAVSAGESFYVWNAKNNPEVYTEAERTEILSRAGDDV